MKNLRIYSVITTDNDPEITNELQGVQKMCIDTLNGIIYFAIGNYKLITVDQQMRVTSKVIIPPEEVDCGESEETKLIKLDFLPDDHKPCLVYENGLILTIYIENMKIKKLCELNKNINNCAWSPDYQFLVVATESHLYMLSKISIMNDNYHEFKILTEAPLRPTSLGKDQLVTIGWGTTETQFQGSAGKQNREKVNPNKIPTPIRSEFDDRQVLISWRADGQFFAVSTVDEVFVPKQADSPSKNILLDKMPCRQLRIWNHELELMSQCEFLSGIETALSMRPTGNLIAVSRLLSNERFIWFFERNGQYRSKFKMPNNELIEDLQSQTVVRNLLWNSDSTILAINISNIKSGVEQLQFWTVSNYSWSEKLRFDVEKIVDLFWDTECNNKFHYITSNGHYNQILLQSQYNCDDILALSMNGSKLRVTDFQMATIPPPLCHHEVPLGLLGAPSDFVYSSEFGLAMIASNHQQMHIFDIDRRRFQYRETVHLMQNSSLLYNLTWHNKNSILAVRTSTKLGLNEIVEIQFRANEKNIVILHHINMQVYAQFVLYTPLVQNLGNSFAMKHEQLPIKGAHGHGKQEELLIIGEDKSHLAEQSYRVKILDTGKESILFTLTNNYVFFIHGRRFHTSIGSFSFYTTLDFLLLLTLDNKLYCIPMQRIQQFILNPSTDTDTSTLLGEGRNIERGAQLVTCESNGTRVWLQMPRGNLEVISPRELVINMLKKLLDEKRWREAFVDMRRHRVDMNLLYDHNPKVFNENVKEFIDQIDDLDHINLFLTSLKNYDSTIQIFGANYPERANEKPPNHKKMEAKINGICEKVRNVLQNIDDPKRKLRFYPAILTTYIEEFPSQISTALINTRDYLAELNGDSSPQIIQRWLRFMNYMVTDEMLFKSALKTYDIDIVLMVAQSSNNMDPREYMPLLTNLKQKSPPAYQRYHVELFLEDWQSALEQISKLIFDTKDPEESSQYLTECLDHIQLYNLHQQALRIFAGKPHYEKICKIAAQHLEKFGLMKEAAMLYEKAGDCTTAMNCLYAIQDFHGYIRLAKLNELPEDRIENMLKKMLVPLEHRDKDLVAADVLMHLGKEKNAERILNCYSKANAWGKLVDFTKESGGEYVLNKSKVILSTRSTQIIEQIDEWRDNINKHSQRLEVLRNEKANKLKQQTMGQNEEEINDGETSSQASNSSLNSRQSAYTTATSRKRKQTERKKQKIKEGSQWEDAAIMVALKAIYTSINRQEDELMELLPALLALDLIDKGRRLQLEMGNLLSYAANLISKIWPEHLEPQHLTGPLAEIYRDSDNFVKWPQNMYNQMPTRVALADELQRPRFTTTTPEWKLNIFT